MMIQRKIAYFWISLFAVAIHSGGIITGTYMNDGAVRCGRLLCKQVSGVFTDNPLQEGYTMVATIPKGASNITITEMKHSSNRLALRMPDEPFFINGDDSGETPSGTIEAADTLFDYHRIGGDEDLEWKRSVVTEWITSTGPITHPIQIMIQAFDQNHGVKYEYLMPVIPTNEHLPPTSDEYSYESGESDEMDEITQSAESEPLLPNRHTLKSSLILTTSTSTSTTTTSTTPAPVSSVRPKRKRRFLWKVTGFAACSKSCGGGYQTPIIRCVRESPLRVFVPRKCEHLKKPDASENAVRCNTQPCPGYWKIGDWGKCDCKSPAVRSSVQLRDIKCVQELGTGMVMQIPAAACAEERPAGQKKCECRASSKLDTFVYTVAGGRNDRKPRPGTMVSDQASPKLRRTRPTQTALVEKRERGVWLTAEWSGSCATGCGATGIEHRTIFCDRPNKFVERCELSMTPETARQCPNPVAACGTAEWLVGTWAQCTGDCFNLTQSRTVQCVQADRIVEGSVCAHSERPIMWRRCEAHDVPYCQDRWHYSQWTECNKKCGGGTQRRTVKCVRPSAHEMKESDGCKYADRLGSYQSCNLESCESSRVESTASNPAEQAQVNLIQNDTTPECVDNLGYCSSVKTNQLCTMPYFQEHCCRTCAQ